ncbi:hypothetical protein BHM03_00020669 [Ensete ventricosum]|nr:hypothetical protein BHM03_00020669 [Ensete ventricosum]
MQESSSWPEYASPSSSSFSSSIPPPPNPSPFLPSPLLPTDSIQSSPLPSAPPTPPHSVLFPLPLFPTSHQNRTKENSNHRIPHHTPPAAARTPTPVGPNPRIPRRSRGAAESSGDRRRGRPSAGQSRRSRIEIAGGEIGAGDRHHEHCLRDFCKPAISCWRTAYKLYQYIFDRQTACALSCHLEAPTSSFDAVRCEEARTQLVPAFDVVSQCCERRAPRKFPRGEPYRLTRVPFDSGTI